MSVTLPLTIHKPDERGVGIIIDDIKAPVILLNTEHMGKIQSERLAKDNSVDAAMNNNSDIFAFLFGTDLPKTVCNPRRKTGNGFALPGRLEV